MMDSLFDISNDELCRIYIDIIKLIELDLIGKTNKKEGYDTINDGTKRLKNR